MEEAIANKKKERERNAHHSSRERESFGHARELVKEGGALTRLEGDMGKLACEFCLKYVCMCVEVER